MNVDAPWLGSYGNVPHTLDYPDCSMVQLVFQAAEKYPGNVAYDFFGCTQTYRKFADEIRECARGLKAMGVGKGDRVTICMPNTPQSVVMLYALNLVGAIGYTIENNNTASKQGPSAASTTLARPQPAPKYTAPPVPASPWVRRGPAGTMAR